MEAACVFRRPVKNTKIILDLTAEINNLHARVGVRCPDSPILEPPSDHKRGGMDLTGFEPTPAVLTGHRASFAPQAHALQHRVRYPDLHGCSSHLDLWISQHRKGVVYNVPSVLPGPKPGTQ